MAFSHLRVRRGPTHDQVRAEAGHRDRHATRIEIGQGLCPSLGEAASRPAGMGPKKNRRTRSFGDWNCFQLKNFQRAGDGTRTHDVQLGKLAFYQLNYAREVAVG